MYRQTINGINISYHLHVHQCRHCTARVFRAKICKGGISVFVPCVWIQFNFFSEERISKKSFRNTIRVWVWIQITPLDSDPEGYPSPTKNTNYPLTFWICFHVFVVFCWLLFQSQLFLRKLLSGTPSECQTVRFQVRSDVLLGLIWIQTVC